MKVLKFGGTSVGTVESLQNVKTIIESIPGQAVIVVSALGGLTDKLINTAKKASNGDKSWEIEMHSIRERHYNIINQVVPYHKRFKIKEKIDCQLEGLQRNFEGVFLLKSLSEKILDVIVSFGERMSSVIVAAMIENGKRYFSPDFIKTEKWYGKNVAVKKLTEDLIKSTFAEIKDNEKAIVPGFISEDSTSGEITNLGRGGSDYTGALIAAALNAEILEIWTDVDGFMTADPRIVKDALFIDHLTFFESMELCTFGAKVIYPPTIYPVFHSNIPIKILNTFNPKAQGTLITDHSEPNDFDIKGVTSLKGLTLISIKSKKDWDGLHILERAFNVLSNAAMKLIPINNPESESKLNFIVNETDALESIEKLKKEFAPEISEGIIEEPILIAKLAALVIVGRDMRSKERLAFRLAHSLERQGIFLYANTIGLSNTTIVYIIKEEQIIKALPLAHSLVF